MTAVEVVVHLVGWAGAGFLPTLRVVGAILLAAGGIGLAKSWRRLSLGNLRNTWRDAPGLERASLVLSGLIFAAVALTAPAPVTDADSIGYHLAIPLEWLRRGAVVPLLESQSSRLIGLGEMMNALGLACGTDALGACVQLLGVVIAVGVLWSTARTPTARAMAILLVATLPVILALVPCEKPELFPGVGIVVAGLFVVERRVSTARDVLLVTTCLASAIASKHSFVLAAGVVTAAAMAASVRARCATRFVGVAVLTAGIVLGPLFARRWLWYGDPLSPLLERFKSHPDPLVLAFARYLRDYGTDRASRGGLLLESVLPTRPGLFQLSLGIGAFAVLCAAPWRARAARATALLAAGSAVVVALFSQISGRYFVEAYLFGAASLIAAPAAWHRWLLVPLGAQGVLVLAGAAVGVVELTPGCFSRGLRETVLVERASEYTEGRWAARVLQPSDVVIYELRGNLFLPAPSVAFDIPGSAGDPRVRGARLREDAREGGATVYMTYHDVADADPMRGCVTGLVAESPNLQQATRNPLGTRPPPYRVYVHRLDIRSPSCNATPPERAP